MQYVVNEEFWKLNASRKAIVSFFHIFLSSGPSSGKRRKSHPMRTRLDSRTGQEPQPESDTGPESGETAAAAAPPLPKPSRQPLAAHKKPSAAHKKPSAGHKAEEHTGAENREKDNKFESMSEKVIKFFHKTPSRFKTKPDPKEKPAGEFPEEWVHNKR